ncbi:MAG: DUF5666 domain-containing protein [Candidatus Limnocylindrales bacterium]
MNRTITFRPIHLAWAAALVAIGLLIGIVATGGRLDTGAGTPAAVALVDAADPVPGTTALPAAAGKGAGLLRLLVGRTVRAEITTESAAGPRQILYVRGKIGDLTSTTLTMALADGTTQKFSVDAQTVVRDKGKTEVLSDLTTSERVMVFGLKNADGTYTARLIRCIQPAAKPAANPGAGAGASPQASPSGG